MFSALLSAENSSPEKRNKLTAGRITFILCSYFFRTRLVCSAYMPANLRLTSFGVNGVGDAGEEAEEAELIVRVVEDFAIWQCCLQFINFFHRDIIGVQADFF